MVTLALNAPPRLAFAEDGSFYVADFRNNRIVHFDANGALLNQWGTKSANDTNNPNPNAPASTFSEPWGVAVGPDGSVYVTDTWNYRVQKFTANGQFVKMWSTFSQGGQAETFYGPRGIAVDAKGRVYVVDTGDKRGRHLRQGWKLPDPVWLGRTRPGPVRRAGWDRHRCKRSGVHHRYVELACAIADTIGRWPDLYSAKQWDVVGWTGELLDNKPFIAVDNAGTSS